MSFSTYFVHPDAHYSKRHGSTTRPRQTSVETVSIGGKSHSSGQPPLRNPGARKIMADIKISFAASQLSEQVKESMRFWHRFHDQYSQEVTGIRTYVEMNVLQQIWQQKVQYQRKSKGGDDDQFEVQTIKLESCLYQVREAAKVHAGAQSFNYSSDYDTQQHHLTKMRTAGDLVVDLSRKSSTSAAACMDLLEELAELAKLADSTRHATSMWHRFDKDTTQSPKMETRNAGQESSHPDTKDMQENSYRSWVGE